MPERTHVYKVIIKILSQACLCLHFSSHHMNIDICYSLYVIHSKRDIFVLFVIELIMIPLMTIYINLIVCAPYVFKSSRTPCRKRREGKPNVNIVMSCRESNVIFTLQKVLYRKWNKITRLSVTVDINILYS